MKRFFILLAFLFPLTLSAQTKLAQPVIDDFSARVAHHYQLKNDSITGYIAEQLTRSGAGGLDIDETVFNLKKDPATLDAALKYLYQYSDCNRQRFISNLRSLALQTNSVFPIATYTANKYKGEVKALLEDKTDFLATYTGPVTGKTPPATVAAAAPSAGTTAANTATAATADNQETTATTSETASNTTNTPAAATVTDTRNWEVKPLFQLRTPEQLVELYGANNITQRDATNLAGNKDGEAYVIYPDTDDELEVQFDGENGNVLTFSHFPSKWKSPYGIKAGDPLEKLIKVNGRPFKINGFEWTNGGIVSNWQGGALEGKGVVIMLKANNTGDPKLYDQVTGDKTVRSDLPALKKLDVIIQSVAFKSN
ncbi:hypothetical protein [Chitinophaga nivalis]|uniref:Uncharacterized protein n=1 Tax=Chitinophaga nivalis TaxID=2991709 RepID=A0ABT3IEG0_9BACT|nr:hypothetical protein [Chitinophaga nivalis]MCW3468023.1 hypothetical protein [Chitinophaga nivalis]MCW3482286.1 hypothetical protein [Chitinophaga nivalis]